jgi:formylmethanofuran dehydrogenase subunit B
VPEVVCAGCGTVCDDVVLSVDPLRVQPGCPVAERWFAARAAADGPDAAVGGEPASLDAALARAADLLRGSRRPLVTGFGGATVEAARAAIALADRVGAAVDSGGGSAAVALRGASTATFGEIRDRARVVVVWREDPEATHPRLLERLRLPRAGRTLVVVDDRDTATAARADMHLRSDGGVEALTRLHARAKGLDDPDGLLDLLHDTPHAAFLHGLTGRAELALHELVRTLNATRHVVTLRLRRSAGTLGAEDALAWQTGYGGTVDLGSGHPEPFTAGDFDVVLSVEGDAAPEGVPVIAVSSAPVTADVVIRTAAPGLGAGGTVHRMDGVPLSVGAALGSDRPGADSVLTRLLEAL